MKLLGASVSAVDAPVVSDGSGGLVPVGPRAVAMRSGEIGLVRSGNAFSGSPRARAGGVNWNDGNWIDATPVEDSETDEARLSLAEYVSGPAWSGKVERTAAALYLFYAAGFAKMKGRLISLYA